VKTVIKMPKRGTVDDPQTEEKMKALGFEFLEPDEAFVLVVLPDGWTRSTNDWSETVFLSWLDDEHDRLRISVYEDENASVLFHNRYMYIVDEYGISHPEAESGNRPWQGVVYDTKKPIWRTSLIEAEPCCNSEEMGVSMAWAEWDKQRSGLDTQCIAYLDAHYPDWRDPFAYW